MHTKWGYTKCTESHTADGCSTHVPGPDERPDGAERPKGVEYGGPPELVDEGGGEAQPCNAPEVHPTIYKGQGAAALRLGDPSREEVVHCGHGDSLQKGIGL